MSCHGDGELHVVDEPSKLSWVRLFGTRLPIVALLNRRAVSFPSARRSTAPEGQSERIIDDALKLVSIYALVPQMCADSTEGVTDVFTLNYFEDMWIPFLQSQEIPDNRLP